MKALVPLFAAALRCGASALAQTLPGPATPSRVTDPEPARPITPGPYAPAWFLDGKFGIFLHWGVYSVAAHQSESYPRDLYATRNEADGRALQFGEGVVYKGRATDAMGR